MKSKLIEPDNARLEVDHYDSHERGRPWYLEGVMFRVEMVKPIDGGLFRYDLRIADSSLEILDKLEERLYNPERADIGLLSAAAEAAYKKHRVLPSFVMGITYAGDLDRFAEESESRMSADAVEKLSFNRRVFQMARYLEGKLKLSVAEEMEMAG